ncbi:transglutaminase family protein [Gryllotalpicola sp.]|uniref:transglutaminase family protein n=1 Tax=Gryllotalpicola sp. TaxID=1932787 RepID=UPI00261C2479|nr:transglutaminase family protein [Gryllotalpicola sp.]
MKRLRVKHITGFRYTGEANASYNEARMLPTSTEGQIVLTCQLEIHPGAQQYTYTDYWGTQVTAFEVLSPHRELTLSASSLIEVGDRTHGAPHDIGWDEVAAIALTRTEYMEQLAQSARTEPDAGLAALARSIADSASGPCDAGEAIARAVGEAMEYVQGVTAVSTSGAEAWEQRRGVCQDIAHVAIGALRSVGLPARYVSGYLHPEPDAEIGRTVTGESHAWVEWFCGEWTGFDPTNQIAIGDRHVLVGRGRDYDDVAPIRGVYAGAGSSQTFVTVEITREG